MEEEKGGTVKVIDDMNTVFVPLDEFGLHILFSLVRDQITRYERPWPFGLPRGIGPENTLYPRLLDQLEHARASLDYPDKTSEEK